MLNDNLHYLVDRIIGIGRSIKLSSHIARKLEGTDSSFETRSTAAFISGNEMHISGEIKMEIPTIETLKANLTSINNIVTEIENIAGMIPFLPAPVQLAFAELKILQELAPAVIADLTDVVIRIEAAYASVKGK